MQKYRYISDPDADEFRPLLPEEMDCVVTAQEYSKFKFNMETCKVLIDRPTSSIVVRGRIADGDLPFEARIHENGTVTLRM